MQAIDSKPQYGHVSLVGAGPGDPELLTLKAIRLIQAAEVVFVDDLVGPAVLAYVRDSARIISVGKRGGCRSTSQSFIERAMVQAARAGQRVVRLKGGDPFVFGRGGEEVDALRRHGIDCDVTPGITAGMAAMASLKTPLTQQGVAQGVVFLTGHNQVGAHAVDWPAMGALVAQQHLTLIIYMAMRNIDAIAEGLLNSLPPATPVAVVQHASCDKQRHLACDLVSVARKVRIQGMASPSVWIVGDVTRGLQAMAQRPVTHELVSAMSPDQRAA